MAGYRLSDRAEADVAQLYAYSVTKFGLSVAEDYFMRMHDAFELIGQNPMIGPSAADVRPSLRRFVHRSHVIFYRVAAPGALIVRILHGAQDPLLHLGEE